MAQAKTRLRTFALGSVRKRGEGLRIAVVRKPPMYLPLRELPKDYEFDIWLPQLAPSHKLLAWWKKQPDDEDGWDRFIARYRDEVAKNRDNRRLVVLLGKLSKRTPLSLGCFCEDKYCHRFELEKLVRAAASGKFKPWPAG